MKITVFGGSGFLGSHVCDKLSEAGHQVTIFDRKSSYWLRNDQNMIVGDILNEKDVEKATTGIDVVFNFAGVADIDEANDRALDTVKYNVLGNSIILEACVQAKIKRYVFASTVYVYSKAGGFYRCSKQACEVFIENYHEVYGLDTTILRYGSLYGPRAGSKNGIYRFVKEALESGEIHYYGNSQALREYIHVEDAARSSVEILKPEFTNEYIILTGHQSMRVGDLFKMIQEIIGKQIHIRYENSKDSVHYEVTPYSFIPKVGKKLSPPLHIDLGQGVLRVIEEHHQMTNID
jgi:UDP-glucose 4-epimerase